MNDIDVFALLSHYRHRLNMTNKDALRYFLYQQTNIPFTLDDLERVEKATPPTTKQWVQYLHREGYTQAKIAEIVGIKQPSVSYHVYDKPAKEYVNRVIYGLAAGYGIPRYNK